MNINLRPELLFTFLNSNFAKNEMISENNNVKSMIVVIIAKKKKNEYLKLKLYVLIVKKSATIKDQQINSVVGFEWFLNKYRAVKYVNRYNVNFIDEKE